MTKIRNHIEALFTEKVAIAPVVTFRVLFGALMMFSVARFVLNGWVASQYIEPEFFFTYYGFGWIAPLPGNLMYIVFAAMFVTACAIMLGYRYRFSAVLFFVLFTYVELIDKTNYLNHYYFVSLVSFLIIFIPANRRFSLDVALGRVQREDTISAFFPIVLKIQLCIVYFFAGIAKINSDWLFKAQPLKIWLAAHVNKPLLGWLLRYEWSAYLFSWAGMLFDVFLPFLIWLKPIQKFVFPVLISFHLLTWWLFPIGMFPFIMIGATLIFLGNSFHERVILFFEELLKFDKKKDFFVSSHHISTFKKYTLILFFAVQILFPFRYLLYPGNLFWTEQGYRFSWRVMLMEKAGHATFYVENDDKKLMVANHDYLTPQQEKMMATQPDMILQFAHHLEEVFSNQGLKDPKVTAEVYVTLNGRRSKQFIDPSIDLTTIEDSWEHKKWISMQ